MRKNEILLNDLQVLILDEVDVLFLDKSFPLQPIGQACPDTTQFLFTSATLPSEVTKQILTEFPNTITLYGPGLHRISPNIHEIVIDCSGDSNQLRSSSTVLENKREALIQALDNDLSERTLIFCNTIEQCRKVENFLLREDRHSKLRDIYIYHSAIDPKKREDNLYQFSKPLLKRPSILICTDRTSRGLDFNRAYVSHLSFIPVSSSLDLSTTIGRLIMLFYSIFRLNRVSIFVVLDEQEELVMSPWRI